MSGPADRVGLDRAEGDGGADLGGPWDAARSRLDGLPGGRGLNIAHEAVDRHAAGADARRAAVVAVDRAGAVTTLTFAELAAATSRFAHVLEGLGVTPGATVATLLGRAPDWPVAALGALKARAVVCPLFTSFGPEPVRERLARGDARVLVTTPAVYRRAVAPVRDALPGLRHVLLTGGGGDAGAPPAGAAWLAPLLAAAPDRYTIGPTSPDDPAFLHVTSGTTGAPKGARHVHGAVVAHAATAEWALDLRAGDVCWCTADPGWVTGTSYGLVAPLVLGATTVLDEGELDAERWYALLEAQHVTVWYTSPTALRMLRRAGVGPAHRHDLSRLRVVASVGEPLDVDVAAWAREACGRPVRDTWWQTETGAIMIAARDDAPPGSMGRPLPGVEATVLALGPDGRAAVVDGAVHAVAAPDVPGELALRPGGPSMFRGYLHDAERTAAAFADGWYLTGDVVRRDAAGWYTFVGRADDVISSAGHLVGPSEVERVLLAHPAVLDAGVVGVPDPLAGQVVAAFVCLRPGWDPTDDLRLDVLAHARRALGAAVAPRQVTFVADLPRTRSGKVVRRLLRDRPLGARAEAVP